MKKRTTDRPLGSFLVRCWLEPTSSAEGEPVVRGYLRNLKTGEETYIGDLHTVEQQILTSLMQEAEIVAAAHKLTPDAQETKAR